MVVWHQHLQIQALMKLDERDMRKVTKKKLSDACQIRQNRSRAVWLSVVHTPHRGPQHMCAASIALWRHTQGFIPFPSSWTSLLISSSPGSEQQYTVSPQWLQRDLQKTADDKSLHEF